MVFWLFFLPFLFVGWLIGYFFNSSFFMSFSNEQFSCTCFCCFSVLFFWLVGFVCVCVGGGGGGGALLLGIFEHTSSHGFTCEIDFFVTSSKLTPGLSTKVFNCVSLYPPMTADQTTVQQTACAFVKCQARVL